MRKWGQDRKGCSSKLILKSPTTMWIGVFLNNELKRKSFSTKWRSWIRECLYVTNAKGWVKAFRGLIQGELFFPFLFTIIADVLSRMMTRAEEIDLFKGFIVGRDKAKVSILQFENDTIFFFKVSPEILQHLKLILWFLGNYQDWKSI